jgi:hypothetical protein
MLASCGGVTPRMALQNLASGDPTRPYIGMSKSDILACVGTPYSSIPSEPGVETLIYRYSGAGPVPNAEPKKKPMSFFGSKDKQDQQKKAGTGSDWTCTASLVFEEGKLTRINYAHRDVHSPFAWQSQKDPEKREAMRDEDVPTCDFSLPDCHPAQ